MASPAVQVPPPSVRPDYRRGIVFGVVSYGLWGLFPLYWPLLRPAGDVEMLAHRMLWSLVFVAVVLTVSGRRGRAGWRAVRAVVRDRRRLGLLAAAAVLITLNWGGYIYGVNNGHVVETALGYFIGPLVSVLVGVLLLGERLRGAQWVAVGLGAAAVVVLTAGYGRPPWIALTLAFSFGSYGLCKKLAATGAVESLAVETGITAAPALIYLIILESTGAGTFTGHGAGHVLLLIATGAVTAIPLLAFGAAATRIPLSLLGLLQYIAPVMQFLLGVLVLGEHMPPERWIGFTMVWLGLAILTWSGLRRSRKVQTGQPSHPRRAHGQVPPPQPLAGPTPRPP
ncbi:MAG TPA: EamA family transporter RarD [Actinophytocola sp.]|uniref:EamA family transporter RarD n=1 Tax=Actinophytocola sp. TaxID=1872138 RepID=UPI002DBDB27E|nr:EamA family transporter RarD [Actinophytocola sp.]HEU5471694.1 EamA family transporter RarD [Actinophytocola sp.]